MASTDNKMASSDNTCGGTTWDEEIGQFVTCLENSGKEGPFWVCAFSIYQSMDKKDGPTIPQQLGEDPFYGPFATVLKGAKYI